MSKWIKIKRKPTVTKAYQIKNRVTLKIKTLNGWVTAGKGDWIIKDVNGVEYPCNEDVFKKTWEIM